MQVSVPSLSDFHSALMRSSIQKYIEKQRSMQMDRFLCAEPDDQLALNRTIGGLCNKFSSINIDYGASTAWMHSLIGT